jgi:hypothetical protein
LDGIHWRLDGRLPTFRSRLGTMEAHDLALEPRADGLTAYMLLRSPTGGLIGTLARADWRHSRWGPLTLLLAPSAEPWENLDLGEPAPFRASGAHYLLYTGTAQDSARRSIGLAREVAPGRWLRCSHSPFIAPGAAWGRALAIDPSPLVVGNCFYVYYGGGTGTSIASDLGGAIGVRVHRLPTTGAQRTRC